MVAIFAGAIGSAYADGSPWRNWGGLYFGATYGLANVDIKGTYATSGALNRHDVDGTSQIRSGLVGFQHQWGQMVLGLEVNYGGTGWSDDWDARSRGPGGACLQGAGFQASCRGRLDSIFTVGPRLGFAPATHWLLFATGGYASARIDTSVLNLGGDTEVRRSSNRHSGWFAGAGVEYNYNDSWSIGLEYQHLSFDTQRHFDSLFGACCTVTPETRDMQADADVIRMRTTFKLNRTEPAAGPMK